MYFFGGLVTLVAMQFVGWLADRFNKRWMFRILALLTVVLILLVTNLPRVRADHVAVYDTIYGHHVRARMVPLMAIVTACAWAAALRGSFMRVSMRRCSRWPAARRRSSRV